MHFAANARDLPWRNPPGHPLPVGDPDWPYRVWLSEIMLQQTTVKTVIPYYNNFLKKFPTIQSMAHALEEDFLKAWQGLGYYNRIRNFHKACKKVAEEMNGRVPTNKLELMELPGLK